MTILSEALCPGLPILLIASSQKGEASRENLLHWASKSGQDMTVKMSGFSNQCCASLGCLSPPFSPLFDTPVWRRIGVPVRISCPPPCLGYAKQDTSGWLLPLPISSFSEVSVGGTTPPNKIWNDSWPRVSL